MKITDAGCEPAALDAAGGPDDVQGARTTAPPKVTEFEVLDGDRILGEVENIAPGLSGEFSAHPRGRRTYTTYCPGGTSAGARAR